MKERILRILKNSKKALSEEELKDAIGIDQEEDISKLLQDMETTYDIYVTTSGKLMDINKSPYRKGIYTTPKGKTGIVTVGDETFLIKHENSYDAVDGDTVLIQPIYTKKSTGNEGNVVQVLSRDLNQIIGEVYHVNEDAFVRPDNFRLLKLSIAIPDQSAIDGAKVIVDLNQQDGNEYYGTIVRTLGYKNDPGVDIESIAYQYGFVKTYNQSTLDEVEKMPDKVLPQDFSGRLDLRDIEIFTIDGKDTKDIDDAISLKELPDGTFLVGVHIADVTHYVKEGSAVDKEAYERGTSGYFANSVYPMLPQKLSNGICSLNPGVDRLAMSVFAKVDQTGKIIDSFITPSVIRSRKQMNYDDVNRILNGETVEGYEPYERTLRKMNEVSQVQIERRNNKGALELDDRELKFIYDDNGHPVEPTVLASHDAEKLIESFMLIANQVAPAKLSQIDAPCIYRVHDKPALSSLDKWMNLFHSMGYEYNKKYDNSCLAVQQLLEATNDKEEKRVLQLYFLRSLMKAVYSAENIGHSGLAMPEYAQFTSPIRRYPDDLLHRFLKSFYMVGDKYTREAVRWDEELKQIYPESTRYHTHIESDYPKEYDAHVREKLPVQADFLSNCEQKAVSCERQVLKMKSAEYMQDHIDEEYEGNVTGIMKNGIFVELDNLINGMIPVSDLGGNFTYNDATMVLEDKKQGKSYHIGDRLLVSTQYANKENGIVNFHLIKVVRPVEFHDIYKEAIEKIKSKKKSFYNKRPYNPRKHK